MMLYTFCGTMLRQDNSCHMALLLTQPQDLPASLLLEYSHPAWLVFCAIDVLLPVDF